MVEKKILRSTDVALRLGHSKPWFYAHRRRLEQLGFPKRDNDLGGWQLNAVDNWLDRRANLTTQSGDEQMALEILHGQVNV